MTEPPDPDALRDAYLALARALTRPDRTTSRPDEGRTERTTR